MYMLSSKVEAVSAEGPETETKRHRIFIVDDHPSIRFGIASLIAMAPDLEVCGEAESAIQALSQLREVEADLAIVDISLPGQNGIELIKCLQSEHPALLFFVLSAHDESVYAVRSLRAGASGYMMKGAAAESIVPALRKVLEGKVYVSAALGERLIHQALRGMKDTDSPLRALSDRELEIFEMVGRGKNSREIAQQLHLSTKTVESHRLRMKEKLGYRNASELVRAAMKWAEETTGTGRDVAAQQEGDPLAWALEAV